MFRSFQSSFYTYFLRILSVAVLFAIIGSITVVSYQYIDPTITLRSYYFRMVIPIGSIVASLCIFNIHRITLPAVDILILVFGCYGILNYYHHGGLQNNQPTELILYTSLYFIIRILIVFWPRITQWIVFTILISGLYESFIGMGQLLGFQMSNHPLYKLTGTFHNPGPYAGYMVAVSCIALAYILRHSKNINFIKAQNVSQTIRQNLTGENLVFSCSCLMILMCILLLPVSMSRSSWLSLALTGVLIVIFETGFRQRVKAFYHAHKMLFYVIIPLTFILLVTVGIGTYFLKQGSADGRLLIWKVSGQLIREHPLTGVGTGNFSRTYAEAQAQYLSTLSDTAPEIQVAGTPSCAFNEYIHLLVEQGVVGLLLFVLILYFTFKSQRSNNRRELLYGIIALLIFATTSYPFHLEPTLILFVICLAVLNNDRVGVNFRPGFILLLFVSIGLQGFYWQKWREEIKAQKEWAQLRQFYNQRLYGTIVNDYKSLYDHLSGEVRFVYEYAYTLNQLGHYAESNMIISQGIKLGINPMFYNIQGNNYRAMKRYECAEQSYRHAYALLPSRLYPLYLLMQMYFEQGDALNGAKTARIVMAFIPKVTSPATASMKAEAKKLLERLDSTAISE